MSVEVRYLGHLGNNLFEYALGRILAEELGEQLRCLPATPLPGWDAVERSAGIVDRLSDCAGAFADAPQTLPGRHNDGEQLRFVLGEKPGWSGHGIDLGYLLRQGAGKRIVLHGYFQRSEYYHPYRERIRRWFRLTAPASGPSLAPDDVLVHLRQSPDMFVLDRAIDLGFYRDLLGGMAHGKVYVCGLGLGPAVRAALAPFDPIYLDLPALATLELMTRANRIVLANSTFSWWGAYLSQAQEIYYPCVMRGFWSRERADVALEVPEDRYRYLRDVAVQTWRPFARAASGALGIKRGDGAEPLLIARLAGRADTAFPLPIAMLALGEWLCRRRTPFGLSDIDEAELAPPARARVASLLIALGKHGVLAASTDDLRALAGYFGSRRLDRLSSMPSPSLAPCGPSARRLGALATNRCEKCGLARRLRRRAA